MLTGRLSGVALFNELSQGLKRSPEQQPSFSSAISSGPVSGFETVDTRRSAGTYRDSIVRVTCAPAIQHGPKNILPFEEFSRAVDLGSAADT